MYHSRTVLAGTALLLMAACRDVAPITAPTAASRRHPPPSSLTAQAGGTPTAAQALTVDQANASGFTVDINLNPPDGLAQGFTPTASRLDAVDLFIVSNGLNPALNLAVHIRSGASDGPVLGTALVPVPANVTGQPPNPTVLQAVFTPIALTPGSLYYIQVDPAGGFVTVAATGSNSNAYPRGDLYHDGAILVGDDMGFRTYFATSAAGGPTTKEQCKNGGWATFTVPRRFKNQGDCIKYVNTGK
jgi:hypothetical protein